MHVTPYDPEAHEFLVNNGYKHLRVELDFSDIGERSLDAYVPTTGEKYAVYIHAKGAEQKRM